MFFLLEQIVLTNVYTVLWRAGIQSLDLKFDNATQINTLNKYLSFQLIQLYYLYTVWNRMMLRLNLLSLSWGSKWSKKEISFQYSCGQSMTLNGVLLNLPGESAHNYINI